MEIKEVTAQRILNPTSLELCEYVINPYRGCAYSCLYCYAQFNKAALKDPREWGEYVDVRINAADLLVKEIKEKRPSRVLIGSTTECFSPVCRQNNVMSDILCVLNEYGVFYSILTRSPLIIDFMDGLSKGFCESVYFTVNNFNNGLKNILEPKSPDFMARIEAVKKLQSNAINVIPYFCPVLPEISDFESIFDTFENVRKIDFEGLNFNLGNIDKIILDISELTPGIGEMYLKMKNDGDYYGLVWDRIRKKVKEKASELKKEHDIFIHEHGKYFENEYNRK